MANATEWGKRVAAWRASGLSAEEFCGDKEYTAKSMWHWSSRLGRAAHSRPASRVASEPPLAVARLVRAGEGAPSGSVVVELSGARIEVQGVVAAATLRAVFDALRGAGAERST